MMSNLANSFQYKCDEIVMKMWHVQKVLKHKVPFSSQFCHYMMKSERHEDASCKECVSKLIVLSHCHENVTKMWWSILSTCFLAPHIWKLPPCKKAMIIHNDHQQCSMSSQLLLFVNDFLTNQRTAEERLQIQI